MPWLFQWRCVEIMQVSGTLRELTVRDVALDRRAGMGLGITRGSSSRIRRALGLSLGMGILYLGGVSQLLLLTGQKLGPVLATGVLPFLLGDLIKGFLALLLLERLQSRNLGCC